MARFLRFVLGSMVACVVAACSNAAMVDAGADSSIDAASSDASPADALVTDAPIPDAPGCADADGDGHPAISCGGDDCDDHDASRYPGNTEVCDAAGHDDDCNPTTLGPDADHDGFVSTTCCNAQPSGTMLCGTDCDDTRAFVNPTAPEVCDGIDDNCNGMTDEGVCVNECALGTPCGVGAGVCTDTLDGYTCTCDPGYSGPPTGGTCADIDECAAGTSGCDAAPAGACTNTVGSFTCGCSVGFAGTGVGVGSCLWSDPSLSALVAATGSLSPAFASATTMYALTLPPGVASVAFTPSVAFPTRATITVDGTVVASGATSAVVTPGFAPSPVTIVVTTESGAMRTYSVVVTRGSTYVKESNTDAGDHFGYALALSADGTTLAVGAHGESSSATGVGGDQTDNGAASSGAVYVFTRVAGVWAQQAYVKASNTDTNDEFGYSVSLSSDGTTLAVGAHYEGSNATGVGGNQADNSASLAGAVYVFTRAGSSWSQQAYVKASNTGVTDEFGNAVSLSPDGSTLAVGAVHEASGATGIGGNQADNTTPLAGAVYVFTRAGVTWSQQAYVKASNTGRGDLFGNAVALSSDGSMLAVGADSESSNATGIGGDETDNSDASAGAVYVFTRAGTAWSQQAYVKASNTDAGDSFGISVALSSDGSTLAVGSLFEESNATGIDGDQANNSLLRAGAAYVFTRAGTAWSQQAYVKASNTGSNDRFGNPVSLSSDGATLAVGAQSESSSATGIGGNQADNSAAGAGAGYVFARVGVSWSQQAYVKASNTGAGDTFGRYLALSSDASTLACGAQSEASNATGIGGNQADNSDATAGAAYVY